MTYLALTREENVHVLTMTNGENDNTFTYEVISAYHARLDEIEKAAGNAALIITSSHEKTWSTGIDAPWFSEQTVREKKRFIREVSLLFLRMALLNLPTIACITGNCYAAGAMMATAMDFRLMRADRGRFCFPEVNVKVPFGNIAGEILRLIPNPHARKELVLTGVAWGGTKCLKEKVVDAIYPAAELPQKAYELAQMLAEKDRKTYTILKRDLKKHLVDLRERETA